MVPFSAVRIGDPSSAMCFSALSDGWYKWFLPLPRPVWLILASRSRLLPQLDFHFPPLISLISRIICYSRLRFGLWIRFFSVGISTLVYFVPGTMSLVIYRTLILPLPILTLLIEITLQHLRPIPSHGTLSA